MHNHIDEGFPVSNNISNFFITTRKVNPFMRGGFDGSIVSQLPAIKEEEGSTLGESVTSSGSTEGEKISTKLSPLNINCFMNVDVKQSHNIWDTNFGKRLINSSDSYGVLSGSDDLIVKIPPSKPIVSKKRVREYKKNHEKDKIQSYQTEHSRNNEDLSTDSRESPDLSDTNTSEKSLERIPNSTETFSKMSEPESIFETTTPSVSSKPIPLSECVKRIFENNYSPSNCEFYDENLSDFENLCIQENQHQFPKESCLLCEEVFYNPTEFAQHLLTHEGVDRFSCKKCMIYFPNSIKYKKHVQEFHCPPPPVVSYIRPPKLDSVEKWCPKYQCKRCKIELDSAKTYETHKRAHLKKDLERAYFLSCNNV